MSEFLDLIREVRIDGEPKRIRIPGSLCAADVRTDNKAREHILECGVLHIIEAKIRTEIYLRHPFQERDPATVNLQHQMCDAVYGDIRRLVNTMWHDVYSLRPLDWPLCERLVATLEKIIAQTKP